MSTFQGQQVELFYHSDDAGLLTGMQVIPSWVRFFDKPAGNRLGLMAASFYLPQVPAAFIGDQIAQRYGRKICIWVGIVIAMGGSLLNALAPSIASWIAGRALIGFGGGLAKIAAPTLIQEIAHPRFRPTLAALYWGFTYIGTVLSAFMTFAGLYIAGDWGWRAPSMLQVFGPSFVMATLCFCPESPRWLYSTGKKEQALNVLSKYHANGDVCDPLVQWQYQEIEDALAQDALKAQSSYLEFFQTPGNRRRLMVLMSLAVGINWIGNGVISYYLVPVLKTVGITGPVQVTLINAGLAVWNLILAGLAAIYADRIGRRPMFLISITGMLINYAFVTGFSAAFATTKNQAIGSAVIAFLFIYYGFYDLAWTPLPVAYTTEILPFRLRTKGMAIFTATATAANAFNQFVNPIALAALAWKYYLVYIAILIFYLIFAYLFYLETKHHTIEEVGMLFDYGRKGESRMSGKARIETPVVEETYAVKDHDEYLEVLM